MPNAGVVFVTAATPNVAGIAVKGFTAAVPNPKPVALNPPVVVTEVVVPPSVKPPAVFAAGNPKFTCVVIGLPKFRPRVKQNSDIIEFSNTELFSTVAMVNA